MKNNIFSTIVFDLGNVLIPFDHSLWIKNFNIIENKLGDDYYEKYRNNYEVHRNYERGLLTDDQFISINLSWLKYKVSEETFVEVFSNIFTLNQNVIDLLPILKSKYKLVLLSNTNNIHTKFGWQKYSFLRYFDRLILSHEIGAVKPEEKIYRAVEKFTGETAESHIFVDDILEYTKAARNFGWDAIQFVGYNYMIEQFKIRNII